MDPETSAHTQTVEGMWRQVKACLPNFGLKPGDLNTYIGTFLWLRYTKQRKLNNFIHFLACVKEQILLNNFDSLKHKKCLHAATKEGTSGEYTIVVDLMDNDFKNVVFFA